MRCAPGEAAFDATRAVLYANRAACHLQLGRPGDALYDCDRAVEFNPAYVKGVGRRAAVLEKLGKLDEALRGEESRERGHGGTSRVQGERAVMLPELVDASTWLDTASLPQSPQLLSWPQTRSAGRSWSRAAAPLGSCTTGSRRRSQSATRN